VTSREELVEAARSIAGLAVEQGFVDGAQVAEILLLLTDRLMADGELIDTLSLKVTSRGDFDEIQRTVEAGISAQLNGMDGEAVEILAGVESYPMALGVMLSITCWAIDLGCAFKRREGRDIATADFWSAWLVDRAAGETYGD
jgi:hypothetical protein